jgi:hypothetical protein
MRRLKICLKTGDQFLPVRHCHLKANFIARFGEIGRLTF